MANTVINEWLAGTFGYINIKLGELKVKRNYFGVSVDRLRTGLLILFSKFKIGRGLVDFFISLERKKDKTFENIIILIFWSIGFYTLIVIILRKFIQ